MRYKLAPNYTFSSTGILCMFAKNYGKSEISFFSPTLSQIPNVKGLFKKHRWNLKLDSWRIRFKLVPAKSSSDERKWKNDNFKPSFQSVFSARTLKWSVVEQFIFFVKCFHGLHTKCSTKVRVPERKHKYILEGREGGREGREGKGGMEGREGGRGEGRGEEMIEWWSGWAGWWMEL